MQHYQMIIGGKEVESDEKIEIINPFTQTPFATVSYGDVTHCIEAIEFANSVVGVTKALPSYKRSEICLAIASQLKKRKNEFAKIISSESGKPLVYSIGEVERCIDTFTIASEEAKRIGGDFFPLDAVSRGEDRYAITHRFPEGIVAGITPFNFPLNLVAHKIAPAIAVGAPIILKPASSTPITAITLGKIISETDWPREAISIIPCTGKNAKPLVEDPRVKVISFTGSADVGWAIKQRCGKKKVILELGGNAGVIIDKDANLQYASKRCVMGSFAYSGQVCISVQRMYVHVSVFDEFVDLFKKETEKLIIGDPLDPTTTFSAMIDEDNAKRVQDWVERAVFAGAEVLFGGERVGSMYPPTALTNVPVNEKVVCEEVFGPVVVIEKFSDFNEAVERVEDSEFGLQAGVFTKDISKILTAFKNINAGGIMINDVPTFRVDQMPYGGNKNSGFGREGIKYTIEKYTQLRLLMINESY
jgi:glyceraldehyde-3-phosphate dehydrogenase (NADP+)